MRTFFTINLKPTASLDKQPSIRYYKVFLFIKIILFIKIYIYIYIIYNDLEKLSIAYFLWYIVLVILDFFLTANKHGHVCVC